MAVARVYETPLRVADYTSPTNTTTLAAAPMTMMDGCDRCLVAVVYCCFAVDCFDVDVVVVVDVATVVVAVVSVWLLQLSVVERP